MSCAQTLAGITRDCEPNMGGVKEVLLANFDDVESVTVSTNQISAITMASSAKFKKYTFKPETASMTSTLNADPKLNLSYISTELVLQFNKMDTQKRVEIGALALGELVSIVKDMNDKYWYLGKDEPVLATAGSGETGTARGDKNAYGITLTDNAKEFPLEVDGDVISGLL